MHSSETATPRTRRSQSICGEALAELRKLETGSFDACIADPPYNMSKKRGLGWAFSRHVTMQENWDQFTKEGYFHFSYQWVSEVCRVVKPNGNIFLFGTYHNIYTMGALLQQLDRKVLNSIVWVKPNAQPNITCRMLTESSEQIVWAANASLRDARNWTFNYAVAKEMNGGKQLRNIWTFPVTARKERVGEHPTQKPLALFERLVRIGTNPGDSILDPFAGVGTTGAAAEKWGRRCVLIEKQRGYVRAQQRRFEAAGLGERFEFLGLEAKRAVAKKPRRRTTEKTRAVEPQL